MAATRKLAGRNVCRVYLLDNTMKTFLVEDDATAGDVGVLVATEMGLPPDSHHCYSLHECFDGVTIGPPLAEARSVVSIMDTWGEATEPKFVFTVKLFMETLKASTHAKAHYMFFIQAVYNVICGVYPVDAEEAVQLAALQVLQKFGPHKPDVHKVGFLAKQLIAYIPGSLLPSKAPSAWEADIFAAHKASKCSQEDAAKEYCARLSAKDYYGCAFYPVTQSFSRKIARQLLIGIACGGVHMFDKRSMATLGKYGLSEIYRWGFKPSASFYFEVKKPGGSGPVYEFATQQGNLISDLLTDYAMALLKEMGIKAAAEDETKTGGDGEANDEEVAKAAARMQAMFRGYRLRRDLEYDYAAVRVQSMYRGYKERCKFDDMIAKMEAELEAAEAAEAAAAGTGDDPAALKAATKLQAAWRGYQDRADLVALEQELAASLVQAQMRGKATRKAMQNQ